MNMVELEGRVHCIRFGEKAIGGELNTFHDFNKASAALEADSVCKVDGCYVQISVLTIIKGAFKFEGERIRIEENPIFPMFNGPIEKIRGYVTEIEVICRGPEPLERICSGYIDNMFKWQAQQAFDNNRVCEIDRINVKIKELKVYEGALYFVAKEVEVLKPPAYNQYIVVTGTDPRDLENEVNNKTRCGYTPQGGVCLRKNNLYYQAMVKENK